MGRVYQRAIGGGQRATEQFQIRGMVRKGGFEPPRVSPPDPKSGASANSATFASEEQGDYTTGLWGHRVAGQSPAFASYCEWLRGTEDSQANGEGGRWGKLPIQEQ